ncbi:hypothetical protein F4561_000842 [Lipingzhangella halophila]|uniref:Uncharacterized protein n=1 Tax=Lipingzhangella halophila TaxID=1783352 RepID=A0A7W7RDJ6_9ACTN|nr:DUF4429 domain-containing protein [Lipingzhangella halophila]MBB4930022.1 hypothetical protein [Lipingzhangella halophila]
MDELQGNQGTWRFDGETVRLRYRTHRRTPALLRALGECRVPIAAVRSVEFQPGFQKAGWRLRLRLIEDANPYSAVNPSPEDDSDPLLLKGDSDSELLAEYFADQLERAVASEVELGSAPDAAQVARGLVPSLPLRALTAEGDGFFDGQTVRFRWNGWLASTSKGNERTREFAVADIAKVEWERQQAMEVGFLRVVPHGAVTTAMADPEQDFTCLCTHGSKGQAQTLVMAAAITAHLRPRDEAAAPAVTAADSDDGTQLIYDRIRELGRLHKEGLLTDEEFSTKKTELLDRL